MRSLCTIRKHCSNVSSTSVIARRVFLQSELPGAPALLPPQGSLPLSLRLSITDAGAAPMAGYRALVFYP